MTSTIEIKRLKTQPLPRFDHLSQSIAKCNQNIAELVLNGLSKNRHAIAMMEKVLRQLKEDLHQECNQQHKSLLLSWFNLSHSKQLQKYDCIFSLYAEEKGFVLKKSLVDSKSYYVKSNLM